MIQLFTEALPYKISEQMLFEYNRRLADVNHFLNGDYSYYSSLKEDKDTIKLLLAISLFYKRILTNFESATKFTSRVIFNSEAKSVQIGTYDLSKKEIFRLKKTILTFNELMKNYSIPLDIFDYLETKDFLRKVKKYRDNLNFKNNNA